MDWRWKAAIQRVLSATPGGGEVNYLLQRLVSRDPRIENSAFLFRANVAIAHLDAAVKALGRPASSLSAYEFGAGSDLVGPLTLRARGVTSQVIVDQDPLLRCELVGRALEQLETQRAALGLSSLPQLRLGSRREVIEDLRSRAGIYYRAPVDARSTGIESGSFDLITSNSTLEHVPRQDLELLVAECTRLLKPDGVMRFRIDYEDHYAIQDRGLSAYNFLRFTEREWRRYNNRLQFQNRLRHKDYVALFERLNLVTVAVETLEPSFEGLAELAAMPIAPEFRAYSLPELGVRKGTFLLRKSLI